VPAVVCDLPGCDPIVTAATTRSRRAPQLGETRYKVIINFVNEHV